MGQMIGVGKDIFGAKSSQDGAQSSSFDFSQNPYAGQFAHGAAAQEKALSGLAGDQSTLLSQLQQKSLANVPQLQQKFGQASLNTEFAGPQFQNGLDAQSRQLVSFEQGNRQAQLQNQMRNIGQQFRGNPGLANILSQQATSQSQLSQNPLAFQAMQGQMGRQIEQANAMQQAQNLTNAARLAQVQSTNAAGQMGNQAALQQQGAQAQAINQGAGLGQANMQIGQSVLDNLQQLAQLFGTKHGNSQQSGRSGGLF